MGGIRTASRTSLPCVAHIRPIGEPCPPLPTAGKQRYPAKALSFSAISAKHGQTFRHLPLEIASCGALRRGCVDGVRLKPPRKCRHFRADASSCLHPSASPRCNPGKCEISDCRSSPNEASFAFRAFRADRTNSKQEDERKQVTSRSQDPSGWTARKFQFKTRLGNDRNRCGASPRVFPYQANRSHISS